MKQISNRHFSLIIDKLPRILKLARQSGGLSLRQAEDIRQLQLLHIQFVKQQQKNSHTNKISTK